jgi:hypothetical protein
MAVSPAALGPGVPSAESVEKKKKRVASPKRERWTTPPNTLPKPNVLSRVEAVFHRPPKIPPRSGEMKILLILNYFITANHSKFFRRIAALCGSLPQMSSYLR